MICTLLSSIHNHDPHDHHYPTTVDSSIVQFHENSHGANNNGNNTIHKLDNTTHHGKPERPSVRVWVTVLLLVFSVVVTGVGAVTSLPWVGMEALSFFRIHLNAHVNHDHEEQLSFPSRLWSTIMIQTTPSQPPPLTNIGNVFHKLFHRKEGAGAFRSRPQSSSRFIVGDEKVADDPSLGETDTPSLPVATHGFLRIPTKRRPLANRLLLDESEIQSGGKIEDNITDNSQNILYSDDDKNDEKVDVHETYHVHPFSLLTFRFAPIATAAETTMMLAEVEQRLRDAFQLALESIAPVHRIAFNITFVQNSNQTLSSFMNPEYYRVEGMVYLEIPEDSTSRNANDTTNSSAVSSSLPTIRQAFPPPPPPTTTMTMAWRIVSIQQQVLASQRGLWTTYHITDRIHEWIPFVILPTQHTTTTTTTPSSSVTITPSPYQVMESVQQQLERAWLGQSSTTTTTSNTRGIRLIQIREWGENTLDYEVFGILTIRGFVVVDEAYNDGQLERYYFDALQTLRRESNMASMIRYVLPLTNGMIPLQPFTVVVEEDDSSNLLALGAMLEMYLYSGFAEWDDSINITTTNPPQTSFISNIQDVIVITTRSNFSIRCMAWAIYARGDETIPSKQQLHMAQQDLLDQLMSYYSTLSRNRTASIPPSLTMIAPDIRIIAISTTTTATANTWDRGVTPVAITQPSQRDGESKESKVWMSVLLSLMIILVGLSVTIAYYTGLGRTSTQLRTALAAVEDLWDDTPTDIANTNKTKMNGGHDELCKMNGIGHVKVENQGGGKSPSLDGEHAGSGYSASPSHPKPPLSSDEPSDCQSSATRSYSSLRQPECENESTIKPQTPPVMIGVVGATVGGRNSTSSSSGSASSTTTTTISNPEDIPESTTVVPTTTESCMPTSNTHSESIFQRAKRMLDQIPTMTMPTIENGDGSNPSTVWTSHRRGSRTVVPVTVSMGDEEPNDVNLVMEHAHTSGSFDSDCYFDDEDEDAAAMTPGHKKSKRGTAIRGKRIHDGAEIRHGPSDPSTHNGSTTPGNASALVLMLPTNHEEEISGTHTTTHEVVASTQTTTTRFDTTLRDGNTGNSPGPNREKDGQDDMDAIIYLGDFDETAEAAARIIPLD